MKSKPEKSRSKVRGKQLRASAYLYDGKGGRLLVTIPVFFDGVIPEEPKVVLFERKAYIQTSTRPLSYVNVLGGRAKKI